jgi:predicted Zn-dependent protease
MKIKLPLRLALLGLILSLLSACATNVAGRKQVLLVSESTAIAASKKAYLDTLAPFDKEGKLDNNPRMVRRVNTITDRLIQEAIKLRPDTKNWAWSVKIIDDPKTVNAWCMAGGKMAIYTGLILQLKATDDEIAQVMGHEISHALANHSAERMSYAMINQLGLTILQASGTLSQQNLGLAAQAAQLALTLPNSRKGETEADRVGIELAAKAGYNPNAAVTLWQKMASVGGGRPPEFLSTHPSPATREKDLKKLIPKMMPFYEASKTSR